MHLRSCQSYKSGKYSARQTIGEKLDAAKIETPCDTVVDETRHVFTPIFIRFNVAHEVEPELREF